MPEDPRIEVENESETAVEMPDQKVKKLQEYESRHSLPVPNVRVFVNCMSLMPEAKVLSAKLFHEAQFDQIFNFLGSTTLGFSILLNYFARVHAYKQTSACLITFNNRVIMPWERDSNPMLLRLGSMLVRPLSYYKNMERVDMLALAQTNFIKSMHESAEVHYPQLRTFIVPVDSRDIATTRAKDIENALLKL